MSLLAPILAALLVGADATPGPRPFAIEVVDGRTGRGVPLIELETVNNIKLVTDSNGLVAFAEPGLMGHSVFFHVRGHGYEFPADGFGIRGKALEVEEGGHARLEVKRINVAERLYRITGEGIYRDSVLLGQEVPIEHSTLNGQVLGSDSVLNAVYRGRLFWFWGDTNRPGYPLGNFHVPGATSRLPADGGLDPSKGVDLDYFLADDGFARETAHMPGEGPTWLGGLVPLRDDEGRERMYALYVKIRPPLEAYEHGLVVWDDEAGRFEHDTTFPEGAPIYPNGHPFTHVDGGVDYVYIPGPFPLTRVKADPAHYRDLSSYEGFTCLKPGTRVEQDQLDRDDDGRLIYAWKPNTPPLSQKDQDRLIEQGTMKPEEALLALRDIETGKKVLAHGGSVYWNEYRDRWIMIAVEIFGSSSVLGEVWYAEADAPTGPWVHARKVVTHDTYSFYNPKQHPEFDQEGGRLIYFEGTYTHSFSGNTVQTPRYDYNQIMYRLDLSDPRLNLPVAIEEPPPGEGGEGAVREISFFALERPGERSVPVFEVLDPRGSRRLVVGEPAGGGSARARFHALPADIKDPPAATVPLYEFRGEGQGDRLYSTAEEVHGYHRAKEPLCRVWEDPIGIELPRR